MYNNHLVDLYKIAGNYVIGAMQKKAPRKSAAAVARKSRCRKIRNRCCWKTRAWTERLMLLRILTKKTRNSFELRKKQPLI